MHSEFCRNFRSIYLAENLCPSLVRKQVAPCTVPQHLLGSSTTQISFFHGTDAFIILSLFSFSNVHYESSVWKATQGFTYLFCQEVLVGQAIQGDLGTHLFQGFQVKGGLEHPFHLFHLSLQGHRVILPCLEVVDLWAEWNIHVKMTSEKTTTLSTH